MTILTLQVIIFLYLLRRKPHSSKLKYSNLIHLPFTLQPRKNFTIFPPPFTSTLARRKYDKPNHQNEDKNTFSTSSAPSLLTTFLFLRRRQVNFYWNLHLGHLTPGGERNILKSRSISEIRWGILFHKVWMYSMENKCIIISFSHFLFRTFKIY